MPNKKDLEQRFGISDNTVYKTLKACGLDTAKEDYSDEEIENYFQVARDLIGSGKRYKDVEEYFGTSNPETEAQNQQQQEQSAPRATAADAVGVAAAEMAVDMVQDAVKQITPHIPNLIAHTLASEMRSPEMKDAFDNMRSEMKQQKESNGNAGVDFLLKKMNDNSGTKQLGERITIKHNCQKLHQLPQRRIRSCYCRIDCHSKARVSEFCRSCSISVEAKGRANRN